MRIVLKKGRDKSLLRRHPWIFSGAIQHVDGEPASGATVDLFSSDQRFLARASFSPHSQIRARVWTLDDEAVDKEFFRTRIRSAIRARTALGLDIDITTAHTGNTEGDKNLSARSAYSTARNDSCRLIYAESDRLPGLIVDRYRDVLVMQLLTAGAEHWRDTFADLLLEETGLSAIYERSDADVRELEGLRAEVGILRGELPDSQVTVTENDLAFRVDFTTGQKTGFYLDQRKNRLLVRELAAEKDVLDCFCYTGGFTVNAMAGGARSVLSIDSSADALELCRENIALNELPADRHTSLQGDVFRLLRRFRDEARSFDMIILDPPKFAPTSAHAAKATRAYKDINLLAFKLLRPGGILFTYSCSGGVDTMLFQKIVASAALDAGVDAQIAAHLSQGADHPVSLHFPEGAYLKGLVCRKQ